MPAGERAMLSGRPMNDHDLAEHAHRTQAGSRPFSSAEIHGCQQGHAAPAAAAS